MRKGPFRPLNSQFFSISSLFFSTPRDKFFPDSARTLTELIGLALLFSLLIRHPGTPCHWKKIAETMLLSRYAQGDWDGGMCH
jgi:hypothetical protein